MARLKHGSSEEVGATPPASQRNGLLNVPVDRIFEFHIHTGIADPIGDAIFGQTTSPLISDKIGNLLSRPRFDFLENGLDR